MKSTSRTQKQLVAENEDLRARLDEAEETLRAIRSGEVDAIIVSGVGGEQIFTLEQLKQEIASLAKFPSENPYPVLRLSRDGILLYANPASRALL